MLAGFEGEPAASLDERRMPHSPLRDVASMLRSFDYAAAHPLYGPGTRTDDHGRAGAAEWAEHHSSAFCGGYASASGRDPRENRPLLNADLTQKAAHELVYELRNSPAWSGIPLRALLAAAEPREAA
ncbi:hypothetical protein [Nocardiopsis deserti]|uniref:hypothetical protein n=1 Tax=Nocardiopsis deserti TaxID=2605988 RepID=UPI00123A9FF0|nr:hypothetical protein [Nocardiopsis deserti]